MKGRFLFSGIKKGTADFIQKRASCLQEIAENASRKINFPEAAIEQIIKIEGGGSALMYSCLTRKLKG